jgi:diguanylate cyclase (GGDEF)-like protein
MQRPPPPEETEEFDASEATRKITIQRSSVDRRIRVHALRVVAGPDMLRHVLLQPGTEQIIGRDDACGLKLSDASVSRRHARAQLGLDGVLTLEDMGSTNGTHVNGHAIDRARVRAGDTLEIGAVPMRLEVLSLDEVDHLVSILARLATGNRDPLTGLLTRAWLEEELPTTLDRCERTRSPVACLFLDVDHFKRINDTWGHAVGDDVLVGVARIVLLLVREQDACVRYGGEEVVCVLPGCDARAALEVAERIRQAIESHDWSRTGQGLRVSASAGVAERRVGEAVRDWLERADRALYAAKAAGRNACRVST